MFPYIPEEIERHILKFYYSINVLEEIKQKESIWINPSRELISMCEELGNFQPKYSDLEKCIKYSKKETDDIKNAVLGCFNGECANCLYNRFPCVNAQHYGGLNIFLSFEYNY